ncbi:RNA polymerase sigma factor [Methylococcus sp. EFPC2]|uniref:RNA polymerase sigma factor n=1 Tax=Methylococcus sp. EFPC2 TaxID=2812648 RepID=UPI001968786D|nr:RNA polymerase sigma factor [Methylococcus sp. EFPC2]QSA96560.1 RNA polymerase sigma factor [Methylococcus sp. EFPC2]
MTGLHAEALTQFFLETREELIRFLLRRLGCPETAADLAQETYLRLHEEQRHVTAVNLRALAFHIAANLSVDHVRRLKTRDRFVVENMDDNDFVVAASCQQPGPERAAIGRQTLERVNRALEELPEESRTALYLSAVDNLTYAQIGELLGVSERMVAKRIADALKHCRVQRDE